jgi:hypothetical protein
MLATRLGFLPALLLALPVLGQAAEPTYWEDVRPILRRHCTVCHNVRNLDEPDVSGGLQLDGYETLLKTVRKEEKLIQPGKAAESLLVRLILLDDPLKRMPLRSKPVPAEQIEVIRRWIDSGAKEGSKPASTTTITRRPARHRKLDVVLPTQLTPPRGVFGPATPAALQLVLRVGPLSPVTAVRFSPDGKLLATGSHGRVTLWDLRTGQPVRVITSVLAAVNDLRFSPDGKYLAVAGGQPSAKGDLRLFRVEDGKLHALLGGHDDVVGCVAFRPDGQRLASASFDKTVRIWSLPDGKLLNVLKGHSDFVYAVDYSPDGKQLVSASKDCTVRLVDADTGKGQLTFSGMNRDVFAVAFHPDGKQVISSGLEPSLYWWDTTSGQRTRLQRGHGTAVHELAFGAQGKMLVSAGGDRTARLWNASNGALVRTISVGSLTYAADLSQDGKWVATGSFDGLVRLYEAATGRELARLLSVEEKEKASWLVLTPQGHTAGSESLRVEGRWRMGGQTLPGEKVWHGLLLPEAVARSLQGEKVSSPTFSQ